MPSFVEIGPSVPEKDFEGFLPYMGMAVIWPRDLDHLYTHWFLFRYILHIKVSFDWLSGFREEDLLKWWKDGRRVPAYPISSPVNLRLRLANNPGHVTKMATMLIYGKDPYEVFYLEQMNRFHRT